MTPASFNARFGLVRAVRRFAPRSWVRWAGAVPAACAALASPQAHAQASGEGQAESQQYQGENGSGKDKPVAVTFNYAGDLNADVSGGQSRGLVYLGRASVLFDADLDHLIGIPDTTAHLSFYDIHGIGLSGRHVDNLLLVSGLEAEPALRLNQIWFQVAPTSAVTLRFGKFTAAQEFMQSKTGNLFVNSTFGWPDSFATDLPSGGPSYPLAAPGLRVAVKPDDRTTLRAAVFAGDPAGPGGGDPQQREKHGFNTFGFSGRPFIIGEVSRTSGGKTPALTLTLGGWAHLDRFAALRNPTVTPGPVAAPLGREPDYAIYGVADGRLWRSLADSKRVVRSFLRLSYSPSDRNVIDLYADAGVTLSAPFAGRDGDKLGLGIAVARISPTLRSAARALLQSGAPATIPPAFEGLAELSYQATVVGPLKLSPTSNTSCTPQAARSRSRRRTDGTQARSCWACGPPCRSEAKVAGRTRTPSSDREAAISPRREAGRRAAERGGGEVELVACVPAAHLRDRPVLGHLRQVGVPGARLAKPQLGHEHVHVVVELDQRAIRAVVVGGDIVPRRVPRRAPQRRQVGSRELVGGAELMLVPRQLEGEMVQCRERCLDHVEHMVVAVAGDEGDEILEPVSGRKTEPVDKEGDQPRRVGAEHGDMTHPQRLDTPAAEPRSGGGHFGDEVEAVPAHVRDLEEARHAGARVALARDAQPHSRQPPLDLRGVGIR